MIACISDVSKVADIHGLKVSSGDGYWCVWDQPGSFSVSCDDGEIAISVVASPVTSDSFDVLQSFLADIDAGLLSDHKVIVETETRFTYSSECECCGFYWGSDEFEIDGERLVIRSGDDHLAGMPVAAECDRFEDIPATLSDWCKEQYGGVGEWMDSYINGLSLLRERGII